MKEQKIFSMTGLGHAEQILDHRKLSVEIRGVNHRYSDIRIRLPQGWAYLEQAIRSPLQEVIGRGRVEISIRWDAESPAADLPQLNPEAVQHYTALYRQLATLLQQPQAVLDVAQCFQLPGVLTTSSPEMSPDHVQQVAMQAFELAFQQFLEMRQQEGKHLCDALLEQLDTLERHMQHILLRLPELPKEHHKRLKERLQQWEMPQAVDPGRLEQELVILAERTDISEEIARIESHVQQFRGLLQQGGVIGKRLDFLCQELHRESNTMSSKSQDRSLSQTLIALKSTVEKLREQVQNLE